MRIFFPIIFAAVLVLVCGGLQALMLALLNRVWWRKRFLRLTSLLLPVVGMLAVGLWGLGEYFDKIWLSLPMSLLAILVFVAELGLVLSLPVSGIVHGVGHLIAHFKKKRAVHREESLDHDRRVFLQFTAAAVPVVALSSGAAGVADSFRAVTVTTKPIEIENLPPQLEGFRILQVSDLHLRNYTTLDTLAEALENARPYHPDLLLVTGDVADDLSQLPGALRLFDQFKAPYGCFASLGNHEYFRGITEVRRIFAAGPIPLLVNDSVRLMVRGAPLFVGAIDDPRHMGARDDAFYRRTIDETLKKSVSGETRVLMSHRPDAFDYAASQGIQLTLAGHTHGGQIGFGGRSIFESSMHDRYLWGEYTKGSSKLYTTSGAGHWFPFRLGCPTEAPVIELRRATMSAAQAA
jgi:uncharacterized protein